MTGAARRWGPAALWAAGIFWVSHQPAVPVPAAWGADKALHFAAYALLGFLLAQGAAGSGASRGWAVGLGWLYGASDELHQAFVPGRSADPADWAADALGVLAGTFFYSRFQAWRVGRSPSGAPSDR